MNIYKFSFDAECPEDGAVITYSVKIKSKQIIMVEAINHEIERYKNALHECIANRLIEAFPDTRQVITAVHQGVKVKTVR